MTHVGIFVLSTRQDAGRHSIGYTSVAGTLGPSTMSAIRSLSGVEQTCVSCIGFLIRHRRELSSPRGTSSCEEVGYNNIMHAAALRPDTFSTMRRLPGARSVGSASRFARKKLVTTTYAYDNNGNLTSSGNELAGNSGFIPIQLRPRKLVPTSVSLHVFRDFRSLCGRQSLIAGEFVLHLAALLRSVCWRVPSRTARPRSRPGAAWWQAGHRRA